MRTTTNLKEKYKMMARDHWSLYLPEMWKDLGETNGRSIAVVEAAVRTQKAVSEKMIKGVRLDEAEDMSELIHDTGQVSLKTTKEVIRTIRAGAIEKMQSIWAVQKQAEEIALNQAIE